MEKQSRKTNTQADKSKTYTAQQPLHDEKPLRDELDDNQVDAMLENSFPQVIRQTPINPAINLLRATQ